MRDIYLTYLNGEACPSKIRNIMITVAVLAVLVFAARAFVVVREPLKVERESFGLGTIIRLTVYGSDKAKLDAAIDDSMREIVRLENLLSVNIPSSDISKINEAAGKNAVSINIETGELIKKAVQWAEASDGAFDPTIGTIVKLWGIGTKTEHVPGHKEIINARKGVNYRFVGIKTLNGECLVSVAAGQSIDLGAIAKGWIADKIALILKERGISCALIDLGGNIVVVGKSPKGELWKLGLQDPVKPRGEYFAVIDAEDISVVTSGPYERFFIKDGVRYHHIFDPATGSPSQSDLSSVTVVNKNSADADALCTMFFVLGFDKSAAFLRKHKDIQAVLVVRDGDKTKVVITPGLKDNFNLKTGAMSFEVLKGVQR